jgi:YcaO-like protein with predicted kinase domain
MELKNKYKARKPEETIQIITDFFTNRGCQVQCTKIWNSEIGTFSCQYNLTFRGHKILTTYGKGATKIYSQASGLGELYERFCAFPVSCWNSLGYNEFQKANYKKHKYYLNEKEQQNNIHQLLENDFTAPYIINANNQKDEKLLEDIFNIRIGDVLCTVPYKNLDTTLPQQEIYTSPLLHGYTSGSNGLAAGNTIEEALIQGISELYERYAQTLFSMQTKTTYYYLNPNTFSDSIQQLIKNITNLGYETKVYDLSYNFNIPVCMILLINKESHHYYCHFGAFPILDIAVERCFTEIYQELTSLKEDETEQGYTKIYENSHVSLDMVTMNSEGSQPEIFLNYNLIINSKMVNKCNDIIFLTTKDYDNNTILQHINKINAINHKQFFYYDLSLIPEMAAVHIVCDDFNYTNLAKSFLNNYTEDYNENPTQFKTIITITKQFLDLCKRYFSNNEPKEISNELNNIIQQIPIEDLNLRLTYLNGISYILAHQIIDPWRCWYDVDQYFNIVIPYYLAGFMENVTYAQTSDFAKNLIPLEFYYNYCIKDKHPLNEYNDIMNFLGIQEAKLQQPLLLAEFIEKAIFKNLQSIYTSQDFQDFINLFVK